MQERLKELQEEAIQKVEQSTSLKELNDIRVAYLGKKGPITEVLRGMGKLSAEERPVMGALANEVREAIAVKIEAKQKGLEESAVLEKLASESIDVTLPGRPVKVGNHHPLTRMIEEIEDLFIGMGYQEGTLLVICRIPSISRKKFFFVPIHHQYRPVRWKNTKGKAQLKLSALVRYTAEIMMTRHTPINSCKSKALLSEKTFA